MARPFPFECVFGDELADPPPDRRRSAIPRAATRTPTHDRTRHATHHPTPPWLRRYASGPVRTPAVPTA